MITIVCWKWRPEKGSKHPEKRRLFSAQHVNNLRSMLERHTTVAHRLMCVTDDPAGFHSSVEPVDIGRHFGKFAELGGCYRRLRSFDMVCGLALFGPRFVSVDLDVVIVGNVDHILKFGEDFRIWGDQYRRRTPYCGSLWGMRPGARQQVWDRFEKDPTGCRIQCQDRRFPGTDQAHISNMLYPREKTWGLEDGVLNFNTQVRKSNAGIHRCADGKLVEIQKRNGELPEGARMVFFNGKYDPSQPDLQDKYEWIGDLWR